MFTLVHTDDYAHMTIFLLYMRNESFFLHLWLPPTRRRNVHSCLLAIQHSIAWPWMLGSNRLKMRHSTCTVLGVQEVFNEPDLVAIIYKIKIILLLKVIPGKNKVCYCQPCQKTKTKHSQCICEGKYGDWLFGKKKKTLTVPSGMLEKVISTTTIIHKYHYCQSNSTNKK